MNLKRQIISTIIAIIGVISFGTIGYSTITSVIKQGDTLITMGEAKQLEALERLVGA